jgi:drug/metabolite transporter (DMT)-like permease
LEPVGLFDKSTSCYCQKKLHAVDSEKSQPLAEVQYELNWGALMVPVRRFMINLSIYVMLGFTFMYADKCGIHTGVVTSLFCSSLIFTIAYFYFRFDQKLQISDWIGILLVVVCVILISISEGAEEGEETHGTDKDPFGKVNVPKEPEGFDWDKLITVVFALGTGLVFSTNSIEMHYSTKNQCVPATVMNVDGNFILGVLVLPFFIVETAMGTVEYSNWDIILANVNIVCIIIASTGLTAAMAVGQAGPV